MEDYKFIATEARKKVLSLIYKAQTSHIGSNFSCADIMTALFSKIDLDKDKFILSAGWKAAMLYYFLWRKGRITEEELNSYCMDGSKFIGLAEPIIPEIIFAGGSMGMGLSAGVALAWSKKQRNQEGTVYVLESDGGIQVGINWEAMWFAQQHKLNNLVLIIDNNGFQAMKSTKEILDCSELRRKIDGFGWDVDEVDGHNHEDIRYSLGRNNEKFIQEYGLQESESPRCIIAHTVKGKGVDFMENSNLWHYKSPNKDEYEAAMKQL